MNVTEDQFRRLKEAVLVKRPILKEILHHNAGKPLYDYARDYINVNLNPPIAGRQDEFLSAVRAETTHRFDAETADQVVKQMAEHYFVSTADHTGPVTHPFFLNSNLLTAASCFGEADPHIKHIVVLSCANVSLGNSSFPRGIFFHSSASGAHETHRLAFFSSNYRPGTVYALPAYGQAELDKIHHEIEVKVSKKKVATEEGEKLRTLFRDVYGAPDVLACKTYSEQISRTNLHLWNRFFHKASFTPPKLVYLEMESIVVRLLREHHLTKPSTINDVLFDPAYEALVSKYFDGIAGAFSTADLSGTYLFWGLNTKTGVRVQMWRQGSELVSQDGSLRVPLTPEAIGEALAKKELIPGLMLCFMVIAFYYGVKCIGGFNQVNYLTYLKNAYIKMQVDRGDYRSIEVCVRSQTKELCDGLTVVFLENLKKNIVLATGPDFILHSTNETWKNFGDIMKTITFEEALNPLMPEIYKITYPESEWDPELAKITDQDVIALTGLKDKIKPCLFIQSAV